MNTDFLFDIAEKINNIVNSSLLQSMEATKEALLNESGLIDGFSGREIKNAVDESRHP